MATCREIELTQLCDMLSPRVIQSRDEEIGAPDSIPAESLEEYIERLREEVSERELEDYIEITSERVQITSERVQKGFGRYGLDRHSVLVKGLKIVVNFHDKPALHPQDKRLDHEKLALQSWRGYPQIVVTEDNTGVSFEFSKNTFVANEEAEEHDNCILLISFKSPAHVTFSGNCFVGVDVHFVVYYRGYSKLILSENHFKNRFTRVIQGSNYSKQAQDQRRSSEPQLAGQSGDERAASTAEIEVRDNCFSQLSLGGGATFIVQGVNKIDELGDAPKKVHWGPYQKIDPSGRFAQKNKVQFVKLKNQAADRGDKFQEAIFQREIIKCETHLLRLEKSLWRSFQDRFILGVGRLVTGHGVYWARPLLILLGFNVLVATSVCFTYSEHEDFNGFWYVFSELFNPVSNLSKTVGVSCAERELWVSALNFAQKFIGGVLAFMMGRVFLRYSGK